MPNRPIHFEIQAEDCDRAMRFYSEALGWSFEDYSQFTGTPYWGVVTGEDDEPGINGGLLPRAGARSAGGVNSFVVTLLVDDYDEAERAILGAGGELVLAKYALPGMAWQGYYRDPEGNTFGIHQADENAA